MNKVAPALASVNIENGFRYFGDGQVAGRPRQAKPSGKRRCYTTPWSIIALATLRKPAMLAPFT